MKITMYELLVMVKDGKAPKKIKYNTFELKRTMSNNLLRMYVDEEGMFFPEYYSGLTLNDEVETLEEEKKIPEKLDWDKNDFTYPEGNLMDEETADMLMEIQDKINNIINILNKGENK